MKNRRYDEVYALVNRVMEETEPYLDRMYTLDDLARECSSNRSYISRAIYRNEKLHFKSFLNRRRADRARELLLQKEENGEFSYTLADVVEISGFASERTFFRVIKRSFGRTPTEMRRDEEI